MGLTAAVLLWNGSLLNFCRGCECVPAARNAKEGVQLTEARRCPYVYNLQLYQYDYVFPNLKYASNLQLVLVDDWLNQTKIFKSLDIIPFKQCEKQYAFTIEQQFKEIFNYDKLVR